MSNDLADRVAASRVLSSMAEPTPASVSILASLIADLESELQRRGDEIAYLRNVVDVCTGTAAMPPLAIGDNEVSNQVVKLRSALVGMVVRELGRSCVQYGGQNNLSVVFTPERGDHEWAGYRYEVHVTKPGGKSPVEQRDEARAEVARLVDERDRALTELRKIGPAVDLLSAVCQATRVVDETMDKLFITRGRLEDARADLAAAHEDSQ